MKKFLSILILLILVSVCCITLSACSSSKKIEGTWIINEEDLNGKLYSPTYLELTINTDGTGTALIKNTNNTHQYTEQCKWEYNNDDKCYYIWYSRVGAYFPGMEVKEKIEFISSTSIKITKVGNAAVNGVDLEGTYTKQ